MSFRENCSPDVIHSLHKHFLSDGLQLYQQGSEIGHNIKEKAFEKNLDSCTFITSQKLSESVLSQFDDVFEEIKSEQLKSSNENNLWTNEYLHNQNHFHIKEHRRTPYFEKELNQICVNESTPKEEINWKKEFEKFEIDVYKPKYSCPFRSSSHIPLFNLPSFQKLENANDILQESQKKGTLNSINELQFSKCPYFNQTRNSSLEISSIKEFYDYPSWAEDYYNNISELLTEGDFEWINLSNDIKTWKKYHNSGLGYEGYAKEMYKNYCFPNDASSVVKSLSIEELKRMLEEEFNVEMIHKVVSYVESYLVNNDKQNEDFLLCHWKILGEAHYLLGNDEMAISAFQQISLTEMLHHGILLSEPSFVTLAFLYLNNQCFHDALNLVKYQLKNDCDETEKEELNLMHEPIDLLEKLNSKHHQSHDSTILWNKLTLKLIISMLSLKCSDMDDISCLEILESNINEETTGIYSCVAFNRLAGAYYCFDHIEKAMKIWHGIKTKFQNYLPTRENLAKGYLKLGQYERTIEECMSSLNIYDSKSLKEILSLASANVKAQALTFK